MGRLIKYIIPVWMPGKKHFFLLICFTLFHLFSKAQASGLVASDSTQVIAYNSQAKELLTTGHYDEAILVLQNALKKNENYMTCYLLSHAYNLEHNWEQAIRSGEQALKLDTAFKNTYTELFIAYYCSGKWSDAKRVSEYALKLDTGGMVPLQISVINAALVSASLSRPMAIFFLFILAVIFFVPVYKASKENTNYFSAASGFRFSELLLLGAGVSCILWLLFFSIANWVWSLHPHINSFETGLYIRSSVYECDGIESSVLYLLIIADIFITLLFMPLLLTIKANKNIYLLVFSMLFLLAGYYFIKIGFSPPIAGINTTNFILPVLITLGALGIYILYQNFGLLAKISVVILAAFASLISLGPPSLSDLSYILDPALRLMHGFKVSEVYFQYDIFLSLLAMAWMKLNINVLIFSYIGQVSFFLFFIGAFFFSDKYFKSKGLSVLFAIALILVRFYAIWGDNPTILQVTPVRLDLWLILLLVVWRKGIRHWLVGITLGLLVLFHRNLGLIYLVSYLELIVMMFLLDIIPLVEQKNVNIKSLTALFIKHLRLNLPNILVLIASVVLCFILFGELFSSSAILYRKLGIGMLPISKISFYWYVFVLFSCFFSTLVYYRNRLGQRYLSMGLFILFIAIGNSMYFFGRSHENNILNISGILILLLFVLFDMLISTTPETIARPAINNNTFKHAFFTFKHAYKSIPVLFILLISFYYSDRIKEKLGIQYEHLVKSEFTYTKQYIPDDIAEIKDVTKGSSKVYMLEFGIDFYYDYYGHYAPLGYFSPSASWVYKKDAINFMQDLLNKGYYIVYHAYNTDYLHEYLSVLKYNQLYRQKDIVAIRYEDTTRKLDMGLSSSQ